MKLFVLSQDVWRWRLVDYDGENQTELVHSEGTWLSYQEALDDLETARKEHPDANLSEERNIVERIVRVAGAGGENSDEAYQRGREEMRREMLEKLG